MINKIIHFSVYHRGIVLALAFILICFGVISFQSLPIDAVPDITNNQVQVNTTINGLAPEEIERTITFPIESSMRGIGGVEQVRSITRFGLSQVTIVFKDEIDIYRARQLVTERLQGVLRNLPEGSESKLGPISSGLGEILQYVLDYKTPASDPDLRMKQLVEIRSLQDWFIKPRLLTIEGVAEINTTGGLEKQYHIQPDPQKMAQNGIHFGDFRQVFEATNKNVGGGLVQQTSEQFLIQGIGIFKDIGDIENLPIKSTENFKTIKVKDIAEVKLGKELRTGAATYNGREVVLGTVMMLLGENSRTVSKRAAIKLEEVTKDLPPDVELKIVYNRSELVDATLGTVEHNLVMGASLVIIILLLLLGNIRAAIITALTIPLTLLSLFSIMKPLGLSGNLMSLGALDFGIIVDGTVIVLDHCVRFIQERIKLLGRSLSREEILSSVYEAAVEIRMAAGFGELVIIAVFLPVFALIGIEGKMFIPMAAAFSIAVFCSLILSFTVAPALAGLFLKGNTSDKEPFFMAFLHKIYDFVFIKSIKFQKTTFSVAIIFLVAGSLLFFKQGGEFLPQLNEGSFAFHLIRPTNISLDRSLDFQTRAEKVLQEFPELSHVFSRIGTSEVATDPMGVNVSDTYIMLKPREEWPAVHNGRKRSKDELAQAIISKLEKEIPGQRYLASQPIQMRFNELLEGTRADVTVKIFGDDLKTLMDTAKEIQEVIEKVPGSGDVEVDLAGTSAVLKVEPKKEILSSLGLTAQEVLETVAVSLGGEEVGYLYEDQRRVPILVRLSDADRADISTVRTLPVGISSNLTLPLEKVAKSEFAETYASINRENSQRRSAVLINLRGRDTESFVQEAMNLVNQKIKLPQGYYLEWGGNFKNLNEAKERLLLLAPIALLLVLLMVFAAFKSIAQTALIMVCVPLALVGGVFGLIFNNLPFSISAGVGFIALSGIAVLNGVVLVNCINHLKEKGLKGVELVKMATSERLRPVLMTAMVAIFGFIPMMLSTGVGAEVQKPLASVVIGGIFFSTLLTLVIIPNLYIRFEKVLNKHS
jgi:cobalt-zinc-cadmium resistance protein CzcA